MTIRHRLSKHRVSVLMCAIAAALSLSAVSATAAQALNWGTAEEGTPYVLSGEASKATSGTAPLILVSTVGKFNVEFYCGASTTSGSVTAGGGGTTTISLSGCTVFEPEPCEVSPITLQAKTELINVGGTTYEKFVPAKGSWFGTFEFKGSKCALNEVETGIAGSFAGLPPQSERAVNRKLSLSGAINKAAGLEVKLGSSTAILAGNITEHLSSAPAGSSWRSRWEGTHGGWEIQEVTPRAFKEPEFASFTGGSFEFGFNYFGTAVSIKCGGPNAMPTLVPGGTEELSGLTLPSCAVSHPESCSVAGNSLKFLPLVGTLQSIGGKYYETFKGGTFLSLSFNGGACPLGEKVWSVSGSFAGLGTEYGFPSLSQPLVFSKANTEIAGGGMSISNGGWSGSAWLNGTVSQQLQALLIGQKWEVF